MKEPVLKDDAFLADVEAAPVHPDLLHLWWLGQSGFLMHWNGQRILVDPYLSDALTEKYAGTDKLHVRVSERVVDPRRLRRINMITASHGHTDHLDALTLREIRRGDMDDVPLHDPWNPLFVAPEAIRKLAEERWGREVDVLLDDAEYRQWNDIRIHAVAAAHEIVEQNDRGRCLYLGYVFRLGPFSIYHSGDTVLYDGLVDRLREFDIDVALLPINGRAPERGVAGNLSGREAAQLAKDIGAKVVIPCHYDMFEFNTADPADEFIPECERIGQPYRVLRLGERFSSSEIPR
jgi:L-ascorbate metabolism protein UlaG (beta-lactamase superfamily)